MAILDLFCGGGGAAEGYRRAFPGERIIGVDMTDHCRSYEAIEGNVEFIQDDALRFLKARGHEFRLIHASPPCQGYSPHVSSASSQYSMTKGKDEPRLIAEVRYWLQARTVPWVIENVMGARDEMKSPTLLCGSMFGLMTTRHRLFETSFPVDLVPHPPCNGLAKRHAVAKGWEYRDMSVTGKGRRKGTAERWSEILGITHPMTQAELAEAIPPAYTQWIGQQFQAQRAAA
jgi:DNA (cytosine-5)-methyltransferase 1